MTTSSLQDWLHANLSLYVPGDLRKRIPLPGVYAIHFPLTDEVFFGQTKHLYRGRLKHLRALKRGVAENKGLQQAFRNSKRAFDFYYINLPQQISKEVAQDYIALHHDHPYLLNEARTDRTPKIHSISCIDNLTSPNKPGSVRLEKKGLQRMSSTQESAAVPQTLLVTDPVIVKALKDAQGADAPLGLVYHTDGGARPNPGPGGWGIHGYLYRAVKPKKGSGNPDHVLTADGYITKTDYSKQKEQDWELSDFQYWLDNPLGRRRYLEITPINYVNGYGWFAEAVTNNIAELVAATAALEHAAQFDIKVVQIRADSQYVCKGLAEYVPTWIRNNWIKNDGFPVKNSEYWKKLVSARDVLVNRGVIVRVDWIKGHNDHLGNELADQAATIGVVKAQQALSNRSWQFNPEGPAVLAYSDLTVTSAEGYWKYDAERHPFISMPRMYFNTCEEYCLPGVYYLGNGKEEEHPGKRISDGAFAVVKLLKPDPVLEMVRYYQGKLADNVMALAQARLDFIYRPDIHKKLTDHGPLVMVQADPARLDTYDLHSLDKDKTREPITRELKPPHLAMRAVENVELLTQKLNQYLSKDPEIVVTDLTDILYEKGQKVVKKETVDICTLKPKYNVGFAALEVNVDYKTDEGISSAPVILTLGIDLIDRNALKRLETSHPKVSLISWLEAPHIFRYASIIEIDGCVGIWAGLYSNLRIVTPTKA